MAGKNVPEIIHDFKVFWDDSFKDTLDDGSGVSSHEASEVSGGGITIKGGYGMASGLGGEVTVIGGQGGFAQGQTAAPDKDENPSQSIALGYNTAAVRSDSFAFGLANKANETRTSESSAIYHGSFTAGYFLYADILNTITTTCQEDGLDFLLEEGQEGLFDVEAFFTIEGEEQIVSSWRDSWLGYIAALEI